MTYNLAELSPEYELPRRIAELEQQLREVRSVQRTNLTLGGSSNGNGLLQVLDSTGAVKVNIDTLGAAFIGTSGQVGVNIYKNQTDYLAGQASGSMYGLTQGSTKNFYLTGPDNIALNFGLGLSFLNSIAATKPAEITTVFRLYTAAMPTGTANPSTDLVDGRFYFDMTTNKLWAYNGAAWKGVTLT